MKLKGSELRKAPVKRGPFPRVFVHEVPPTPRSKRRHMVTSVLERHPLGPTAAVHELISHAVRAAHVPTSHMKLAVAIQFWRGDMRQALRLARFLADLEPRKREDVCLVFARRFDVKVTPELESTMLYCGQKFSVTTIASDRQAEGHPDGCYGLWSGTAEKLVAARSDKWPYDNVFFVEADGVPMRWDWIEHLKRVHAEHLATGYRITGARMYRGERHVNGSFVMHSSFFEDHPSLAKCRSRVPWDCHHGPVLMPEAGPIPSVMNLYGAKNVTQSVFTTLGYEYAWLASVKDGSAWKCSQRLLEVWP